jgi:hypothetical protein
MLRSLSVLLLLAVAATAGAQQAAPVYQSQKSATGFHLEGLTRQEWTDEETFLSTNRRLLRLKPRVDFSSKWFQLGLGADFTYGSDHNLDVPAGMATLPLLRDNYDSRDLRLDLAFVRLIPVKFVSAEGGRFPMPVRFTEMIWDHDLRAQGGSATLDLGAIGPIKKLAFTGVYARGSHILPEEGFFQYQFQDRDTVWIGSGTMTFSAGAQDRIELLGSILKFEDLQFVDPRLRRQNTRVNGSLAVPYEVLDFVARYHGQGKFSTTLAADYCWNRAVSSANRGVWLALLLGSTDTARGSFEYTFAKVDKDATLAAYTTDDFIWGTGWAGHRADLGIRMSDRASSHLVGQLQRFKDSPNVAERDTYVKRLRAEVRISY